MRLSYAFILRFYVRSHAEFIFEDPNSELLKLQQVVVSKIFQICAIKHECTIEPMEMSFTLLNSGQKRLVISDS